MLHTSGTTSRPKIVPLTHTNILTSARNVRSALKLVESDLCLNIMPLFHIHGLIGATLSSLVAGAGIVCSPGFEISRFFGWLEEFGPTWYTAVPTIHQSILDASSEHLETIACCPMRFIRSCSSPLPPTVMVGLVWAVMPVVFTSILPHETEADDKKSINWMGDVVYDISQTPQVWLDLLVEEEAGALMLRWNGVEELFPEGLLDDMFAAYCRLLQRLANKEESWHESWYEMAENLVPSVQLRQRAAINSTEVPVGKHQLY